MNFEDVYDIWFKLPEKYKIPINKKDKEYIDNYLYNIFKEKIDESIIIESKKYKIGKIVYYDQIMSHFYRKLNIDQEFRNKDIYEYRENIIPISYHLLNNLEDITEDELVYILFPIKHNNLDMNLIEYIMKWMNIHNYITFYELNLLKKFYKDTIQKIYESKKQLDIIESDLNFTYYDFENVCDKFYDKTLQYNNKLDLCNIEFKFNKVIVSISGGIDSMSLLYLLKNKGIDVIAFHLMYNNRKESYNEYQLIHNYCKEIGVSLYTYSIENLRRKTIDRDFYENLTRYIRFKCYKQLDRPVILGHIRDDLIENIWTNFAGGKELFNLGKMNEIDIIDGVTIYRPFLHLSKKEIFEFANMYQISYTKNTTPEWSNRGKLRNTFLECVKNQFGEGVDENIFYLYNSLKNYKEYLDTHLFNKFFEKDLEKYSENVYKINILNYKKLSLHFWNEIFIRFFNNNLYINQPSKKSIVQFLEKINSGFVGKFMMKKNIIIHIMKDNIIMIEKIYN